MSLIKNYPMEIMTVTSAFGYRTHPVTGEKTSFHNGADYRAAIGTPLYAVADGKVVISKVNGGGVTKGYGYYQAIEHDGFVSLYGHMKELFLDVRDVVQAGDFIGYSGGTGASTGAHLHFEIRLGSYDSAFWLKETTGQYVKTVDPQVFLMEERGEEDMSEEISEWAKDAQEYVIDKGISDGTRPKDNVTREELWTIVYRVIKLFTKNI